MDNGSDGACGRRATRPLPRATLVHRLAATTRMLVLLDIRLYMCPRATIYTTVFASKKKKKKRPYARALPGASVVVNKA